MVKQLLILLVIFGINRAMNVDRELTVEARNGDSVAATDRVCKDEGCENTNKDPSDRFCTDSTFWGWCSFCVLADQCSDSNLCQNCPASCGNCCGNSYFPNCGQIVSFGLCNVDGFSHLCRLACNIC